MELKYKSIKDVLISIFVGFSIGLSVIVPGISGSAIAMIMKVYDKLMYAFSNIFKKFNNIKATALAGFLFSLSVELVQLFNWGSSDINDLMTNTGGACIGYLIYCLFLYFITTLWTIRYSDSSI